MEKLKRGWQKTPAPFRKVGVAIVGSLVVIVGIMLLALPGPGWATIFVGLAILATEFATADRLKHKLIDIFKSAADQVRQRVQKKKK